MAVALILLLSERGYVALRALHSRKVEQPFGVGYLLPRLG